ncbi:helix-turn-helix transcriptional regulator [Mycoplasmatota bacterium WC44]
MDNIMIGNFIKDLMKQRNMTNRDLINELEKRHISMSEANMSKLLNGKHGTDIQNYMEIADVFHISIDELLKAKLDVIELDSKTDKNKKNNKFAKLFAMSPFISIVLYFIMGYALDWWHVAWLAFILVPVAGILSTDDINKN